MVAQGEKERVKWIQGLVDELSLVLAQAVKSVKNGEVILKERYSEDYGSYDAEEETREWTSPKNARIGSYRFACHRSFIRTRDGVEDWLLVVVSTPRRGKAPKAGLSVEILNGKVQNYSFSVVHPDQSITSITFDDKGKAVNAVSPWGKELLSVKLKTIPKSYIPKFPAPK